MTYRDALLYLASEKCDRFAIHPDTAAILAKFIEDMCRIPEDERDNALAALASFFRDRDIDITL